MKLENSDDQLMVQAAVGYCLGRATYIVPVCCDWLTAIWPQVESTARQIICRDIIVAIQTDRAGHEMDVERWVKFLKRAEITGSEWERIRQSVAYTGKPWPLEDKI